MRKLILIAHISLDGYVANADSKLDDFDAAEENLQFVGELTAQADAALLGRKSYETMNSFWTAKKNDPQATRGEITYSAWYNSAQKIIVSASMKDKISKGVIISNKVADRISEIKSEAGKDILIFGSPSIAQLLATAHLIDEYRIFVNPAIFGNGIPLFAKENFLTRLTLHSAKQFANGEIGLHYSTC